jgi:hypothetical protein
LFAMLVVTYKFMQTRRHLRRKRRFAVNNVVSCFLL